ncbi:MAG: FAD-dependent oxidoreductase [Planctomycetota bacterium]|nr:FAD-dependent oxidoreductase [Planctomycetota bacterium]
MNGEKHVCVIGGGIVGACSAYFLNRSGYRVTIIEADRFGYGCSRGNCGYVSPSHVLPIAVPGIVGSTMKSMMSRKSPFYIKPRVDLSLWSWLFKFWRRCNRRDMLASARVKHALLQSSFGLYEEFMQTEPVNCDWEHRGLLFVYKDQKHFEHYSETNRMIEEEYGVSAKPLPSPELMEFEPAMKPEVAGAWLYECDAHLRSDYLMESFKNLLESRGVVIREKTSFEGFESAGSSSATSRGIKTSSGTVEADFFVMATGALTPRFAGEIGCKVPIQPGKGYSITMPRPARCPRVPMIFEQHRVAITPFQSGYRIGSTMELAGYDSTINRDRLDLLRESAELYLQDPHCDPVEMEWFGWRPLTYDDLPIIDFTPRWENVMVAAGHGMLGLSMGMVTGKLVDEMLRGETTHIDRRWVSFARLSG